MDSLCKAAFPRDAQRIHKGLESKKIPHGVAFKCRPRTFYVDGAAICVRAGCRKSDFVAAKGGEVGLLRETKGSAAAVGIPDVDERSVLVQRQGLETEGMVSGAERPAGGGQRYAQVVRLLARDPEVVKNRVGVFRRLILFAAQVESQSPAVLPFLPGACLDVRVEKQNVAPVCRYSEGVNDLFEGIIENPVNIHRRVLALLGGLDKKREAEAVFIQTGQIPAIRIEQLVPVAWRLSGSRHAAGQKPDRGQYYRAQSLQEASVRIHRWRPFRPGENMSCPVVP